MSLRLDLPDDVLELLADAVANRLTDRQAPAADGWMDTRAAAEYLGLSTHALHRLVARREVPYFQDGPGAKCYFRRSALDAWRGG
jgi:excisionase family DNA binding protein